MGDSETRGNLTFSEHSQETELGPVARVDHRVEEAREKAICHLHGRFAFLGRLDIRLGREYVLLERRRSSFLEKDIREEFQVCGVESARTLKESASRTFWDALLISEVLVIVFRSD